MRGDLRGVRVIPACNRATAELEARKLQPVSIEREYEIVLQPEPEGGFSVFVPELPSVATQGETIEEATEMAKEAIEAYLEVTIGNEARHRSRLTSTADDEQREDNPRVESEECSKGDEGQLRSRHLYNVVPGARPPYAAARDPFAVTNRGT